MPVVKLYGQIIAVTAIEPAGSNYKGFIVFMKGKHLPCPFCTAIKTDGAWTGILYIAAASIAFEHIIGQ